MNAKQFVVNNSVDIFVSPFVSQKKWQQFKSLAKYMQIKRAKENKKHKNWPENKRNDLLDAKINKN